MDNNYFISGSPAEGQERMIQRSEANTSPWSPIYVGIPQDQAWTGVDDSVRNRPRNSSEEALQGSDQDAIPAEEEKKKDKKKKDKKKKKDGRVDAKDAKRHSKKDGKEGDSKKKDHGQKGRPRGGGGGIIL